MFQGLAARSRGGVAAWVAACALVGWGASAQAQEGEGPIEPPVGEGFVTPSETQLELYTEGAKAFQEGNFEKARQLFLASLRLGELNVTYLNYGRTLFRLGDCQGAGQAYADALRAPKVSSPTPAQVLEKVGQYQQELVGACPATLTIECPEPQTQLFLDEVGPLPCDGLGLPVLLGEHVVRGVLGERRVERRVSVVAMEQARVRLELPPAEGGVGPSPSDGGELGHPTFTLGANLSLLVNASAEFTRLRDNLLEDLGTQQDASLLSVRLHGTGALGWGFHLGFSAGLYPLYEIETDLRTTVASTVAGDVDGLLLFAWPLGRFAPFLFAEGGWSFVSSPQDELDSFQGYNAGGGAGLFWGVVPSVLLHVQLLLQFYEVSRDLEASTLRDGAPSSPVGPGAQGGFVEEGATVRETLTGQRVMLGVGLTLGW